MRKAHVLKHNRSSPFPVRMVFFDTETDAIDLGNNQVEHKFKLGWACYYERRSKRANGTIEWYKIENPEEFWDWVEAFDLTVLHGYEELRRRGYVLKKFWERGLAKYFKWMKPKKTIVALDNANIFPGKLESLGESLGLPKLEVDFSSASEEYLSVYCKRDVEILLKAWQRWINFCKEEDLGSFGVTLAAQAFNSFRHRFMPVKIYIHDNEKVLQLERNCYKGGRCECFFIGVAPEGRYYYLDVNSMYPYVMREFVYPIKLVRYVEKPTVNYLKRVIGEYLVCAHLRVKINVPAFPVRYKQKTFYPVGEFDCYLTTPEIEFVLEHGKVLKVHEMALYRFASIFKEYVEYFYNQRLLAKEKGDSSLAYFYKIMLNSLYGKFGQKSTRWKIIGKCDPEIEEVEQVVDAETGKRYLIRKHNGIVEQTCEPEESFNSFPAIAAHVTAYARMYLFFLIQKAGFENVFYTDTDSLIVNEEGYGKLMEMIDNKKLGYLKLEEVSDYLELRGPKDYTFGTINRIKGVRSSAVKIAPNVFEQEKWLGFSSRLRMGKLNTYIVEKIKKSLRRDYAKGRITESGRVTPWVLPEEWEIVSSVL